MPVAKQSRPFAELVELESLVLLSSALPCEIANETRKKAVSQRVHCEALDHVKTSASLLQASRITYALRAYVLGQQMPVVAARHAGADRIRGGRSGDIALVLADGRELLCELKTSSTSGSGTDRNWGHRSISPWLTGFSCAEELVALKHGTLAALNLSATTSLSEAQDFLSTHPAANATASSLASPVLTRMRDAFLSSHAESPDPGAWRLELLHALLGTTSMLWIHVRAAEVRIQEERGAPVSAEDLALEPADDGSTSAAQIVRYGPNGRTVLWRFAFSQTRGAGVSPFCMRLFRGSGQ